ncbi:hypothetical protein Taro_008733 [Colocasia esculenta]|uniref:Uncharacterized protein n=1 Tax=Colocasia esculenta TaxID=4460 RepID=A0A843U4B0_COLES|nr:hypothetical protein [Colocasia esculenta]
MDKTEQTKFLEELIKQYLSTDKMCLSTDEVCLSTAKQHLSTDPVFQHNHDNVRVWCVDQIKARGSDLLWT